MTPRFSNFVLAGFASLALGSAALAGGLQAPGSLLIFPLFDNSRGFHTFITVTNSADHNPGGGTASLRVEYVYIRHEEQFLPNGAPNPAFALDCTEFNRTRILTPQDTLTVDTKIDNPNQTHQGYVYVFAKNAANAAISFNFLMGEVRVASTDPGESYEMQAFTYKAIAAENPSSTPPPPPVTSTSTTRNTKRCRTCSSSRVSRVRTPARLTRWKPNRPSC